MYIAYTNMSNTITIIVVCNPTHWCSEIAYSTRRQWIAVKFEYRSNFINCCIIFKHFES